MTAERPVPARLERSTAFALALIAAAVAIAFWPCLGNDFAPLDDDVQLTANPLVHEFGLAQLRGILTSFQLGNYQPLTTLSFLFEFHAFGLEPRGYHAVSLALHIANSLLVYALVARLGAGAYASLAAALLFGVHPLRVESVAWISDRKDLLCGFFFLLSLLAWLAPRREGAGGWRFASLAAFLAALLAKSSALTLPVVLLLLDHYQGRRLSRESLKQKAPFFALSLIFGGVALLARRTFEDALQEGAVSFVGLVGLAVNRLPGYFLRRFVLPGGFDVLYPSAVLRGDLPGALPGLVAAMAMVLVLAAVVLLFGRRSRSVVFGALFFLVTLAPALTVINIGHFADRFVYLPAIGIFFPLGVGLAALRGSATAGGALRRRAVDVAFALVVAAMILLSRQACATWKDGAAFWAQAAKHFPAVSRFRVDTGQALASSGDYRKAIEAYGQALAIDPRSQEALFNRAKAHAHLGDYAASERDCTRLLEIEPRHALAYALRGVDAWSLGRPAVALADLDEALRIDPSLRPARINRADLLAELGERERARADYAFVLASNPNDPDALAGLRRLGLDTGVTGSAGERERQP